MNARGTLVALWAAKQADVPRLVFSSSNAPLGDNAYPASEDKPMAPLSPYGAGKATGEAYCSAFHGAYGLDAVAVRFSNAYGPRSARKTNVIPLFIRKAMAGEPLTIYGDGTQTRDFVFVTDLANGLIRAATTPGAGGEVFQLASGIETSLNDLVGMIREVSGRDLEVQHEPPRAGEIQRNYSLIGKAEERLGYRPAVVLADGVQRTWQWFADTGRYTGGLPSQPPASSERSHQAVTAATSTPRCAGAYGASRRRALPSWLRIPVRLPRRSRCSETATWTSPW